MTAEPGTPRRHAPEIHHTHQNVVGGWLRPSVFGASDGLVSNLALVAGVAGAGAETGVVVLAGLSGLLAGAFSMATGEYISVTSQAELTRREIAIERAEILRRPAAEQAELAAVYRGRGLRPELADEVARALSADPDQVWRVHAREELGVDPDDLPSPWLAAAASFAAFVSGAVVPVVPYLLGAGSLLVALVVSLVGLFAVGAAVSRFTTRTALFSGLRQLVLGGLTAAVTYGVGSLVGVGLG